MLKTAKHLLDIGLVDQSHIDRAGNLYELVTQAGSGLPYPTLLASPDEMRVQSTPDPVIPLTLARLAIDAGLINSDNVDAVSGAPSAVVNCVFGDLETQVPSEWFNYHLEVQVGNAGNYEKWFEDVYESEPPPELDQPHTQCVVYLAVEFSGQPYGCSIGSAIQRLEQLSPGLGLHLMRLLNLSSDFLPHFIRPGDAESLVDQWIWGGDYEYTLEMMAGDLDPDEDPEGHEAAMADLISPGEVATTYPKDFVHAAFSEREDDERPALHSLLPDPEAPEMLNDVIASANRVASLLASDPLLPNLHGLCADTFAPALFIDWPSTEDSPLYRAFNTFYEYMQQDSNDGYTLLQAGLAAVPVSSAVDLLNLRKRLQNGIALFNALCELLLLLDDNAHDD
jgi:hypothetical protein